MTRPGQPIDPPPPPRCICIEVPPGTPYPLIDRIVATLLPGLMPDVEAQMETEIEP